MSDKFSESKSSQSSQSQSRKPNSNTKKAKKIQYQHDARSYEQDCFDALDASFQKYNNKCIQKTNYKISLPTAAQEILAHHFNEQWPDVNKKAKKEIITHDSFSNLEVDYICLIDSDLTDKLITIQLEENPILINIKPPCIIVVECTISPERTPYKFFTLEKACFTIKTLPYLFFTPAQMNQKSIDEFTILPLLITNHSQIKSLDAFKLNAFKLQKQCEEEKKDGGILVKPLSNQITLQKNQSYNESMTMEDLETLITTMRSFSCLYLYKKEYTVATFFTLHDDLKTYIELKESKIETMMKNQDQQMKNQDQQMKNQDQQMKNIQDQMKNIQDQMKNMKDQIVEEILKQLKK